MYVGMSALRHTLAAMEYTFSTLRIFRFLCSQHTGNQIQCFYIAMEKPGILCCNQMNRNAVVCNFCRGQHNPDIRSHIICESMLADTAAASCLPVNKLFSVIHLAYHFRKQSFHFILCLCNTDTHKCCAVIETVNMFIQIINDMISGVGCVIHTVSEIACSVQHRNRHFFQFTVFSVVIPKCFHMYFLS
ncbi:hypothetical protein IMSAG013_00535 [Clostridiales bacterium]|nr:hypothetical protein IMSAG013_00535 [Clostridiales bacterium]